MADAKTALLREAAALFREYERHHRAKITEAGRPEKAERNRDIAERIEAALVPSAGPAVDAFLDEVRAELIRARAKFPGDRIMTIALAEEFGELCKAILDEPRANVRKEAVQTAVMAARVVLDGDGSVNAWRAERGLDPLVEPGPPGNPPPYDPREHDAKQALLSALQAVAGDRRLALGARHRQRIAAAIIHATGGEDVRR